jgi:[protein-PII] uridylyltransferase
LAKRLEILAGAPASGAPRVRWESVELISQDSKAWTLLFRGMDQRGLLWNAAQNLFQAGLEIKSARVQTWGEKAEDLFVVEAPKENPADWLAGFRRRLEISNQK